MMRISFIFFFAILFLGNSCTKEHDMMNIEEEPFTPISNVETKSLAISLSRDIYFTCIINGQEYISEDPGILILENLLLKKEGNVITIKSDGYYDEIRYVIPSPGARLYLEVRMTEHRYFEGFNAKEGGTIAINDIEMVFEPNSIVDADGNDFDGEVKASAKHARSELYVSLSRTFTQNTFMLNGKNHTLNLAGGVDIMLIDDLLNPLFLKKDATAEFSFRVNSQENPVTHDDYEILLYDDVDEEWQRIGQANKDGEKWYGNLSDLGRLIWGVPYESRLAEIKYVTDNGSAIVNSFVFLFTKYGNPMSIGFSDDEGNLRIYVPVNEGFTLRSYEFCGALFQSQEYSAVGSGVEDVLSLKNYTIESFNQGHIYNAFNGNAVECNGEVIKESAIILPTRHGFNSVIFSDGNGNFNFVFPRCSDSHVEISMIDIGSKTKSNAYLYENGDEPHIDLGSVLICEEYDYFINYSINDREYPFPVKTMLTTSFNGLKYTSVITSNLTQQPGPENQTIIFFGHEEALAEGTYNIGSISLKFNNVLYNYDYECTSDCNGSINIVQKNEQWAYEGTILHTDPATSEVIKGAFRIPGQ